LRAVCDGEIGVVSWGLLSAYGIKAVQKWISLSILSIIPPHWRCYSFHKNSSIKQCAAEHCDSKWLIKIDIERFFESITEKQVYDFFKNLGYKTLVSFELARLCTVEPKHVVRQYANRWVLYNKEVGQVPYNRRLPKYFGRLPQGAPTSPQLSNLIFESIDELFQDLALSHKMTYTRYADDITFSSSKKNFGRKQVLSVISKVNSILKENGFNPQHKKLKILPPGSKKVVLGLAVDGNRPRLTKSYRKKIESHLRGMETFGILEHMLHRRFRSINGMLDHVKGLIIYASYIEPEYGEKQRRRFDSVVQSAGME
jgi:RNA-directed DNA polymerase